MCVYVYGRKGGEVGGSHVRLGIGGYSEKKTTNKFESRQNKISLLLSQQHVINHVLDQEANIPFFFFFFFFFLQALAII